MNKQFEILIKTRKHLIELTRELTTEQLNEIPPGFNNNIAWNLGHLLASQQGLCYLRAGLPLCIEENLYEQFKPGSKPETGIDENELKMIQMLLLSVLERFEKDYENSIFKNYTAWINRYGIGISTIQDAIAYVICHEGLHLGYVMALKRLVKK